MTIEIHARTSARATAGAPSKPAISFNDSDFDVLAQHMYTLMLRNVTSDGYVITDPTNGALSKPGCIIAAPSFPQNTPGVDQNYVFNWVRDGAITALEIAAAIEPGTAGAQTLIDYVTFARLCQDNAAPTLAHAVFTVNGQPRPWTEQTDGPALQILAVLKAYDRLDGPTQAVAKNLIGTNLDFLLGNYQSPTVNLWEEHRGLSFFARSAQLRCFHEIAVNTLGIVVPPALQDAIAWLKSALDAHWNGSSYVTLLNSDVPSTVAYDPNIDIVCAYIYGAVPCMDTRLLATAAKLRSQWADAGAPTVYPINIEDHARGLGPLLGRYPGDVYDGDVRNPVPGRHPWALCTSNFAQLYYTLAHAIEGGGAIPYDALAAPFFAQVGVTQTTNAADAIIALNAAGDAMLNAVIFHSDHLELSEQFDGTSGYERSVRNLTWSYAAFLSAVRAKTGNAVKG